MNLNEAYKSVNSMFASLREDFHKFGGLDDSNAKIDEVAKIFATYLAFKQKKINNFPNLALDDIEFINQLQEAFLETTKLKENFANNKPIFGQNPELNLTLDNVSIGKKLVKSVVESIDIALSLDTEEHSFDLLNEFFGHFIRDNFRGNIEDAQYMTPPEVVDFIVNMAFNDLEDIIKTSKEFIVLDPSCGVGSFLTSFADRIENNNLENKAKISLYGQDKVERMVRLSTLNLNLHNSINHQIFYGNSLYKNSELTKLNGKVDLILTNPPFGAMFDTKEINENIGDNISIFTNTDKIFKKIDSEILFLDRYLTLLKENGHMLVVVPEGILSSGGLSAYLRQNYSSKVNIKAIIELPPVTFAQAGTRIKTSIIYLQKVKKPKNHKVIMSTITDLGFQVSSKKGVNLKTAQGLNELSLAEKVIKDYLSSANSSNNILSENPSITLVDQDDVFNGTWTANHYNAKRFISTNFINDNEDFEAKKLSELVQFKSQQTKREITKPNTVFVSVLHILSDNFIDIDSALEYVPKTHGYRVEEGDLIFSKINPRIPRMAILPNFGKDTLCSTEFEIITPIDDTNLYEIMYLLQTDIVQKQILSLTSGTSSSHNRIKTKELMEIKVPILKESSKYYKEYKSFIKTYEKTIKNMMVENLKLSVSKKSNSHIFSV